MAVVPAAIGFVRWTESDQKVERDCLTAKEGGMSALVLPSSTLTSLFGEKRSIHPTLRMPTSRDLSTQHREPKLLDHGEKLMSGIADRPGHKRDLSQYSHRLETFECGPEAWSRAFPSPHRLALVGFYYSGYEHIVRCYFCEVEISEWDDGKDPLIKHYHRNPNCTFLKGFSSELKKLLSSERVPHLSPQYASSSLRLHTFSNWQHSNLITSYQLASAGFFYTGHGLRVECFSCGLTYQDWKKGDLPLHVHRQRSPKCSFISSLLSKESSGSLDLMTLAQQRPPVASDYPASRAPDYASLELRIKSFKHLATNFPVSGERCAEAGLFLLRKPDVMKCFSCGFIVRDWIDGDIPEEKHREVNPSCKFLCETFPSKFSGSGDDSQGHEAGMEVAVDPNTLPEPEFDEDDLERMSMIERVKLDQIDPTQSQLWEVAESLSKVTLGSPTSQSSVVSKDLVYVRFIA